MSVLNGIDPSTLSLQMKSIVVFNFLNEYNELERAIRDIFKKSIASFPANIKQQLYFYYGGKIEPYIEYESQTLKINNLKYDDNEQFKRLTVNQIIKIFKTNHCIPAFDFSVESILHPTNEIQFYDCAIRLINMRNKLAHEVVDLQFDDKDLIELLTCEQIAQESFDLLQNYDISKIDNMTQYIASNIIYMHKIIPKLKI